MSDLNDSNFGEGESGGVVPESSIPGVGKGAIEEGGIDEGLEIGEGAIVVEEEGRVVTARGTENGLVFRIDGKAEWDVIVADLEAILGNRKKFFEGGEVSVEWLDRLPTKEQSKELEVLLKEEYGMNIIARKGRAGGGGTGEKKVRRQKKNSNGDKGAKNGGGVTIPLFEQVEQSSSPSSSGLRGEHDYDALVAGVCEQSGDPLMAAAMENGEGGFVGSAKDYVNQMSKILGDDVFYEDDANSKVVFGTLRSGQKVESPFSLVIIGDVNPGADIISGGDIIVLGSLRGTAHASAYDDECFDRVIIALTMQPMQLRIGSVISRGSDEVVDGAEVARIENRRIVVEAFNPRAVWTKNIGIR